MFCPIGWDVLFHGVGQIGRAVQILQLNRDETVEACLFFYVHYIHCYVHRVFYCYSGCCEKVYIVYIKTKIFIYDRAGTGGRRERGDEECQVRLEFGGLPEGRVQKLDYDMNM